MKVSVAWLGKPSRSLGGWASVAGWAGSVAPRRVPVSRLRCVYGSAMVAVVVCDVAYLQHMDRRGSMWTGSHDKV